MSLEQEERQVNLELYAAANHLLRKVGTSRIEIGEYIGDVEGISWFDPEKHPLAAHLMSQRTDMTSRTLVVSEWPKKVRIKFKGSFSPNIIERDREKIRLTLIGYAENAITLKILVDRNGNIESARLKDPIQLSIEQISEIIRVLKDNPRVFPAEDFL